MSNVVMSNSSIGLLVFDQVLAPIECASVMHLTRNTDRIFPDHPFSKALDERLCELLKFQLTHHTPWSVLRAADGKLYPPHLDDYFLPPADDTRHMTTFMVFLNDMYEGGKLVFPEIQLTIAPKQGHGVMWQSASRGKQNPLAIYARTRVTKGEQAVLMKWFVR